MKSKMRFKNFGSGVRVVLSVPQDIGVLCFCFPEVVGVEIALLVEDFSVGEPEAIGGMPFYPDHDPADEVLAEVEDLFTFGRGNDPQGREGLMLADRFVGRGDKV